MTDASRKRSLGDELRANVVKATRQKIEDDATAKKEARELLDVFIPRLIGACDKMLTRASLDAQETAMLTLYWDTDWKNVFVQTDMPRGYAEFDDGQLFTVNLRKALSLERQYCVQTICDHYKNEIDVESDAASTSGSINFRFNWVVTKPPQ